MNLLDKIDMFVGYTQTDIREESEYAKFFKAKMRDHDVTSPSQLDAEGKTKFFNEIKAEWKKGSGKISEDWYMVSEMNAWQEHIKSKLKGKSLGDMSDDETKKFFEDAKNTFDGKRTDEGELPPALKKAIEAKKKKDGGKDEEDGESKEHEDSESDKEEKEEHKKDGKKDKADK
jgi:hypothetical protein